MIIRLQGVSHTYKTPTGDARIVLRLDDWTLTSGDQVLLRGVSGSGKTTLFNIAAGLLRPTQGAVWFDQTSLYKLPEQTRDRFRARMIGYIFQTHHLLPQLSALENVVMPMAFARKTAPKTWRPDAARLLERVGLGDYVDYHPAQLSTGQRLRAAVARALATQPPLVLADEPTAALDPENSQLVIDLLETVCRENNAILLVASHDPALSARFTQEVHLQAGRLSGDIQATDTTGGVYAAPTEDSAVLHSVLSTQDSVV